MNITNLTKGSDITVFVNDTPLRFVSEFCVKQNRNEYKIIEFLTDEETAVVPLKNTYTVELTTLSDSNFNDVFCDECVIKAAQGEYTHIYRHCKIEQRLRTATPSGNIYDKYTIIAKDMTVLGGSDNEL